MSIFSYSPRSLKVLDNSSSEYVQKKVSSPRFEFSVVTTILILVGRKYMEWRWLAFLPHLYDTGTRKEAELDKICKYIYKWTMKNIETVGADCNSKPKSQIQNRRQKVSTRSNLQIGSPSLWKSGKLHKITTAVLGIKHTFSLIFQNQITVLGTYMYTCTYMLPLLSIRTPKFAISSIEAILEKRKIYDKDST